MHPVCSTLLACFCRKFLVISAIVISFNFFLYSSVFCEASHFFVANLTR